MAPAPDARLPPPPLPLLPEPPPPPPLPAATAFPLLLAFLAGASAGEATMAAAPPSADPLLVTPGRLVPFPAARAGPMCVNTQVPPKRYLPFFYHCLHSASRAPAPLVRMVVRWWTSALMRPPLGM